MSNDPTPDQIKSAQEAVNEATESVRRIMDDHLDDFTPANLAVLTGLVGPATDMVGAASADISRAKHEVYCMIFKELLPVHTALMEVTDRSMADHIVIDIFMNTLAVTMVRFGEVL